MPISQNKLAGIFTVGLVEGPSHLICYHKGWKILGQTHATLAMSFFTLRSKSKIKIVNNKISTHKVVNKCCLYTHVTYSAFLSTDSWLKLN